MADGKAVIVGLIARAFGYGRSVALLVGAGMFQIGVPGNAAQCQAVRDLVVAPATALPDDLRG